MEDESQDPLGIACMSAFQIVEQLDAVISDIDDERLDWEQTISKIRERVAKAREHATDILGAVAAAK